MSETPSHNHEEYTAYEKQMNKQRADHLINLMRADHADVLPNGRIEYSPEARLAAEAEMNVYLEAAAIAETEPEMAVAFETQIHSPRIFAYEEIIDLICKHEDLIEEDLKLYRFVESDKQELLQMILYRDLTRTKRVYYEYGLDCSYRITPNSAIIESEDNSHIYRWIEDMDVLIEKQKAVLDPTFESNKFNDSDPFDDDFASLEIITMYVPEVGEWLTGNDLLTYLEGDDEDDLPQTHN